MLNILEHNIRMQNRFYQKLGLPITLETLIKKEKALVLNASDSNRRLHNDKRRDHQQTQSSLFVLQLISVCS